MQDYHENKESSYLKYWVVNILHGCTISQKLPVNNFQSIDVTSQFNEDFIKSYNKENDEGHFLEVDVQYSEKIHEIHNDWTFLTERIKIGKAERLATNFHDETENVIRTEHY